MKERLQIVINEFLMSISAFARSIEVSDDTIRKILRGKQEMSPSVLKKILETYKNIDRGWFETGEGEMPKLLTIKSAPPELRVAEEEIVSIGNRCIKCEQKDKEISALKDEIIRLLKEASELKKATSG